jgi:hypothetical protein
MGRWLARSADGRLHLQGEGKSDFGEFFGVTCHEGVMKDLESGILVMERGTTHYVGLVCCPTEAGETHVTWPEFAEEEAMLSWQILVKL